MLNALHALRELTFLQDDHACFIERDRILTSLTSACEASTAPDRFARVFAALLSRLSTPVDPSDVFVGRMVEAVPDPASEAEGFQAPHCLFWSDGHKNFDYSMILSLGIDGIRARIRENAARLGDELSLEYAANAEISLDAVLAYADRWADAADKAGKPACARALRTCLRTGADDLHSALQIIWLVHMIASCCVGARDYAFGYFDRVLLPYYEASRAAGLSREDAAAMLACFFVKTNEICGRTADNHLCKPVFSNSSNQYVLLDGGHANDLSLVILDAARHLNMAQPQFTVMLAKNAPEAFRAKVFETMEVILEKVHVFNYDLIVRALTKKGIPAEIAENVTLSACCTMDLDHHTTGRNEYYVPTMQIFSRVLRERDYESVDELLDAWKVALTADMQEKADAFAQVNIDLQRRMYVFDAYMLSDCIEICRYPKSLALPWHVINYFFSGIATMGNSLAALDTMVFQGKKYGYREFIDVLDRNFEGAQALLTRLQRLPKFGNDLPVDEYVTRAGNAFADAVDALKLRQGWFGLGAVYSLERDQSWADQVPATPDGRLAYTLFSENQSPVYGTDTEGVTALLKSVSKMPFERLAAGGLNLTFSQPVKAETLRALYQGYFALDGLHAGVAVLDRTQLEDAMVHPEKYPRLTVRLYGFSQYFVSLAPWQQLSVINRTMN